MKDEHYIEKGELDWLLEQEARELAWEMEELRELEEQERIQELKVQAAHGQKFKDGPKNRRQDKLSKEIEKTCLLLKRQKGKKLTAKEVFLALPVGAKKVIQKIDVKGNIVWNNGVRRKRTAFKSFENRLTTIKKKIS